MALDLDTVGGLAASCERSIAPQSSSASRFTAGACGFSNQASGRNDIGNLALRNDALQPELARAMEDYNKIGTNTKCQCALSMSGHWGEAGSNAAAR
jgi:hypothetical protein